MFGRIKRGIGKGARAIGRTAKGALNSPIARTGLGTLMGGPVGAVISGGGGSALMNLLPSSGGGGSSAPSPTNPAPKSSAPSSDRQKLIPLGMGLGVLYFIFKK